MFQTAFATPAPRHPAGMYQTIHAATGVHAASPHALIAMLYDGLAGSIAAARGALARGDVPARGKAIAKALRILDEGLVEGLDHERGGKLAADLHGLYDYVSLRLMQANAKVDDAALIECATLVETLRSAWAGIADRVPNA